MKKYQKKGGKEVPAIISVLYTERPPLKAGPQKCSQKNTKEGLYI